MPRPIVAKIYPSAIAHNLDIIRQNAPRSKTFAVIKANAYGHGIAHVYPGLQAADALALLDIEEAITLRQLGWRKPILLLEGFFDVSDLALGFMYKLDYVVHTIQQVDMLQAFLSTQMVPGKSLPCIFLKFNSGMNRLGFDAAHYAKAYQVLRGLQHAGKISGVIHMTHFANSDHIDGVTQPLARFLELTKNYPEAKTTSNSAAILWHADAHLDWVRAGIILYGASPSGVFADIANKNLQPSMSLGSRVIATQTLSAGDAVGYGGTFVANQPCKIAVVACGYADGYPRYLAKPSPVWIHGQRAPVVGRVSMDMITVDVTHVDAHVDVGDAVELWGKNLPIDDVAQCAQTIGYDLLCAVTKRVKFEVQLS